MTLSSGGLFTREKTAEWRVNTLFYNFLARCREKNDHLIFRGIATNGAYHWSVTWILIMESCFQKDIWGQGNLEIQTCFYWVSLEKLYHVNELRFLQSASPYIIFIIYIQSISLCALKAKTIKTTSYNLIFFSVDLLAKVVISRKRMTLPAWPWRLSENGDKIFFLVFFNLILWNATLPVFMKYCS